MGLSLPGPWFDPASASLRADASRRIEKDGAARRLGHMKAVRVQSLPGLKGPPLSSVLFTGLKAGASTVVPLSRHIDTGRYFSASCEVVPLHVFVPKGEFFNLLSRFRMRECARFSEKAASTPGPSNEIRKIAGGAPPSLLTSVLNRRLVPVISKNAVAVRPEPR